MQEVKEKHDIPPTGAARHDGSVRIYEIEDTDVYIQSDVTVDEYLDENDCEIGVGER